MKTPSKNFTWSFHLKLALARQTAHGGNDAVAFVPTHLVYHNFLKYYVYNFVKFENVVIFQGV